MIRVRLLTASIAAGKVFTARPFRFTGQFRTCRYQDRQSIIGLVSTPALAEWRKAIAAVAPDLEFTIPHVTPYTLDGRGHRPYLGGRIC